MPEKTFKEKILVVEDDQGEADILRIALEASQYHVDVVTRAVGDSDLDLAAYQLVIIEQCAYADLLYARNKTLRLCDVSIIVLSSSQDNDDIIRALDAGADDCVVKPFTIKELKARVLSIMRRRRVLEQYKHQ